ncbi:MAG: hypothetical protein IKE55_00045 [Kiritimatiellae bacterium]|nr:hypothetical protein [Kiritimatiellia bacterium]
MRWGLAAACLCAAFAAAGAEVDATLLSGGAVQLRLGREYRISPMSFLPGWRGADVKGGYEIKTPGEASFRFADGGREVMDAAVKVEQLEGGRVRLGYALAAKEDVTFLNLGCVLHFGTNDVDGLDWQMEGKRGKFAHPGGDGMLLAAGKGSAFALPLGRSGRTLRIEAEKPVDYLIQDNRKWSDTYAVRLGVLGKCRYAKGEAVRLSFVLSSDVPLRARSAMPYVVEAGEEWIPIDYRRDIEAGSALDFSGMGFTDAPAGGHGWLKNVGGHFEFEGRPGVAKRFYGVNLCGTANYPDHALADALVARFKRLGYNAIRIHHHDAGSVAGSADGLTLNQDNMERLDYLVAAAIREGLYVTTDLFVSRARVVKWRHIGVDRDGNVDMQLFKALCAVYEPALRNWAVYAKNFLLHENRHTGRRYVDEPALPLISLVNEGGFFMGWGRGVRDDPRMVASWKAWLGRKRAADPSFAPGVSPDELPRNYWDKAARPVLEEWAGGLEARMVSWMKAYLRKLGCKALITNDNCGPHYTVRNGMAGDYDYVDDHFYVDHPSFLDKPWNLPSRCPNVNPLLGDRPIMPVGHDFPRACGKPFTVTEWNFSGPGRYRGVGGILTGATAALRDWDGLWRFAYSHSRDGLKDADVRSPGYFDLASDPLSQASDRASICLFLRGDLRPGQDSRLCIDRERGAFTIRTPRTCGGFVPGGEMDAGALWAKVEGAPATVWVHSLDGAEIPKSRRMLLTHLTDVQGDGERFSDETMKVLLKWGRRPLVRNGAADVLLRLSEPGRHIVYELGTGGRRVRVVPAEAGASGLRFRATVAGPSGARILYEIAERAAP